MNYKQFVNQAHRLRCETFIAFAEHGEAHLGGSFSMIEGLIALYESVLEADDKFILSKAHASFPMCLLLRQKGLDPPVTTHLELDPRNGIHATTGSLGHGLPIATGMALGRKLRGIGGRIFVMMSDGECQEGTTWESLLIGSRHQLDNLVVIVDYNKIQALTRLDDALPLNDLAEKFRAFNWDCDEVLDGHNFSEIIPALKDCSNGRPRAVLLHTIKGKGVPEFENDPAWHAKKIKQQELEIGKRALGIK
jgi:transketolase